MDFFSRAPGNPRSLYPLGMPLPALSPFGILSTGFKFLRRHFLLGIGIATLGALLSALGPLLQIRLGLPDDPLTELALRAVAVLPLDLYFVPRFLAFLDAETTDHPQNRMSEWQEHFEKRWLKAFGIRMLLYLAVGGGLAMLVLPGLILMVVFGWAPLRVLLRGDSFLVAARNSMALMVKAWPRVIPTALLLLGGYLLVIFGLGLALQRLVPEPSPWQRLTHPVIWLGHFLGGLLDLLLSLCFLALYLTVEPMLEEKQEGAE